MASKRQAANSGDSPPGKRYRRGIDDNSSHDVPSDDPFAEDSQSDAEPEDMQAEYKLNGERRALSEASRELKYVCDYPGCGLRFNRPCRLEDHRWSHTGMRPFPCPRDGCEKAFTRKDHLKQHLKHQHDNVPKARRWVCDWEGCGKAVVSESHLKKHRLTHKTKFYCTGYPPCKEHFRKQKTLDAHIKSQHLESAAYPCTHVDPDTGKQCSKGYQTDQALRRHVQKSHDEVEKERFYFCAICPAPGTEVDTIETPRGLVTMAEEPLGFSAYQDLVNHNREVHPPICNRCGVEFKTKAILDEHYKTICGDDKPQLPCPYDSCGRVFHRQQNLNVHIKSVHEGEKRFVCKAGAFTDSKKTDLSAWDGHDACGTAFAAKASLENHVRTQHLDPLMNRKDRRKAAQSKKPAKSRKKPEPDVFRLLTGHGFDGGRTIPCEIPDCGDRFFRGIDYRRHLQAVHGMDEQEAAEKDLERGAREGGQFWIGGLGNPSLGSVYSSYPQTPDLSHGASPHTADSLSNTTAQMAIDPRITSPMAISNLANELLIEEEEAAALDKEMGLEHIEAWNMEHGLPPA